MYIRICRFYVAYWTHVSCALPVHLLLYFRFSLIVLYTFHWKSGILILHDIEQYTDSNTCKFFLHCNRKYNIFRPNTKVYHSKLLCLDCIYCTSDYNESTTGMICLKIIYIYFFYPKCQYVILESYSYMCMVSPCWKYAQVSLV